MIISNYCSMNLTTMNQYAKSLFALLLSMGFATICEAQSNQSTEPSQDELKGFGSHIFRSTTLTPPDRPGHIVITMPLKPPAPTFGSSSKSFLPLTSKFDCPTPYLASGAMAYGLEGATILRFLIGEDGKVKATSIQKSSGWKILDQNALTNLLSCKFEPLLQDGRPISYWTKVAYVWKQDVELPTKPQLLRETCGPLSDELTIAKDNDVRADIRLRFQVETYRKVDEVIIENSSGDVQADKAAVKFIESCKFRPGFRYGKTWGGASSMRFYWKGNEDLRELIHNDDAFVAYRDHYVSAHGHKVFAQSESDRWAWISDIPDVDNAKKIALEYCNENMKAGEKTCEVINVDDEWYGETPKKDE